MAMRASSIVALCVFFHLASIQASRIVNISDAWLLIDSESPVFYRHFRDRVTWSEAEAICQFHHSVLATVRNTGEFDRTRALLQELDWKTPVWVGLSRVLGQPMFKWSTPAGATLLPSDGYWHEAPNTLTSRALCVTVDPSADYRWRALDCGSSTELYSFLCQIPVPTWARSEHGGCLSPNWPSAEVTVQYLPQTRALEMTANCGLKGTKRIACKQHSVVDIAHMEAKLQCPSNDYTPKMGSATPPRPPTRHRRDTNPSTAPTPEVSEPPQSVVSSSPVITVSGTSDPVQDFTNSHSEPAPNTEKEQDISARTIDVTPEVFTQGQLAIDQVTVGTSSEASVTGGRSDSSTPRLVVTVEPSVANPAPNIVMENTYYDPSASYDPSVVITIPHILVTPAPTPKKELENNQVVTNEAVTAQNKLIKSTLSPDVLITTMDHEMMIKDQEPATDAPSTPSTTVQYVTSDSNPAPTRAPSTEPVVTTPKHPAYLYSKSVVSSSSSSSETTTPTLDHLVVATSVTLQPSPVAPRTNSLTPIQSMQPMTPHHVVAGTPRNIAHITHVANHPPMIAAIPHPGLPRNVPSPPLISQPQQSPIINAEGSPRNIGNAEMAEIHRSAEDHVASRRRQFLPGPLRGLPPLTTSTTSSTPRPQKPQGPRYANSSPEYSDEQEDQQEQEQEEQTTVDALNSQTEEEMMEADQRRQHSRRINRPQQSSHQSRNLYPYLINRMLG